MEVFTITVPETTVQLDEGRQGRISFTVSNVTGRPLEGRARLEPAEPAQESWYAVEGEVQRSFGPDESHQFTVKIQAPETAPEGRTSFRLAVDSVENPDEDFAEGPEVAVKVPSTGEGDGGEGGFPMWILAVVGGVLLVGGIVWLLIAAPWANGGEGVPDVTGRHVEDARQALTDAGLPLTLGGDSALSREDLAALAVDSVRDSLVVRQEPEPGGELAQGEAVTLILGRIAPSLETDVTPPQVDEGWFGIPVQLTSDTLVTLAAMQTFNGSDPAGVRMRRPGPGQLQVMIEEEQSGGDTETVHGNAEAVGYLVAEPAILYSAAGEAVGELVRLETDQPDASTWHTRQLSDDRSGAVVFAVLSSFEGGDPSHVRLRSVTDDSFEFQIEEWDYLDGGHTTEVVSFAAVDSGAHRLPDGRMLQAGTVETDHQWKAVFFPERFASTPVVFAISQTARGGQAVVARTRQVSAPGFEVRLQEETANEGGGHATETVGWIAVSPSAPDSAGAP